MRAERFFQQDNKLIYHKRTDLAPSLAAVRVARDMADAGESKVDGWHVGRVDAHVLELWLQEAGVKMHERDKVKEVIRKKLLDGDNSAFRVKTGTF